MGEGALQFQGKPLHPSAGGGGRRLPDVLLIPRFWPDPTKNGKRNPFCQRTGVVLGQVISAFCHTVSPQLGSSVVYDGPFRVCRLSCNRASDEFHEIS